MADGTFKEADPRLKFQPRARPSKNNRNLPGGRRRRCPPFIRMKDMRRWIACLAVVLLCMQPARPTRGMWLMHRLAEIYPQMKARGLKNQG